MSPKGLLKDVTALSGVLPVPRAGLTSGSGLQLVTCMPIVSSGHSPGRRVGALSGWTWPPRRHSVRRVSQPHLLNSASGGNRRPADGDGPPAAPHPAGLPSGASGAACISLTVPFLARLARAREQEGGVCMATRALRPGGALQLGPGWLPVTAPRGPWLQLGSVRMVVLTVLEVPLVTETFWIKARSPLRGAEALSVPIGNHADEGAQTLGFGCS